MSKILNPILDALLGVLLALAIYTGLAMFGNVHARAADGAACDPQSTVAAALTQAAAYGITVVHVQGDEFDTLYDAMQKRLGPAPFEFEPDAVLIGKSPTRPGEVVLGFVEAQCIRAVLTFSEAVFNDILRIAKGQEV